MVCFVILIYFFSFFNMSLKGNIENPVPFPKEKIICVLSSFC